MSLLSASEISQQYVMRSPRTVGVDLTSRCNLRCRYCYFFDNPEIQYQDLPTSVWRRFFDELGSLAVMDVVIAGGEPFMRDDLRDLLAGIVENRMRFAILSNGTLINNEIATFIADTGRCNYIQVSIDGADSETHDACRGSGSFDAAMQGLQILIRHDIQATVRVTIHRHNVHQLEKIAHLLLDELALPSFSTNSAGYLGTCRTHADEVMLDINDRRIAMATLLRLNKKYNGRIIASAGPLADAHMWQNMEIAREKGALPFARGGRLTACGCPGDKIAVRPDGAITSCNMLPHMVLGYINQDSLTDIWLYSVKLNELRMRKTIPLTQFEFCTDCDYIPYCTGNCPALAYSLTGKVNHPSPDACLRRYLTNGGKLVFVDADGK
jgi:SynChlorMet cassette radical SAM/SPASM protein ScmE